MVRSKNGSAVWHGPAPAGKSEIRRQLLRRSRGQVVRILNEADVRYKRGRKGSRLHVHVGSKGRVHGLRHSRKLSPNSQLAKINSKVATLIKQGNGAMYQRAVELARKDPQRKQFAEAFLVRKHLTKMVAQALKKSGSI